MKLIRYLISGSSDERAYIWNIDWPTPLVALEGHAAEVTCVAWCTYGEPKIVTCSDDAKHKVWRVGSENMDNALLRGQSKKIATYTNASKNSDALEYTPKSVKRWVGRSEKTPSTGSNIKTKIQCDICESRTPIIDHTQKRKCVQCEILNAQSSGRTLKRNSSDMLGTSDVEEDQAPDKKRIHLENRGARRLFEPGTSTDLSTIMEENEPGCSTSLNPMTPVCDRDKSLFSTPQSSRALTFNSPTANLPNYVLSGEAPHLRNISPKKKCKENIDWLTKIIKQKRLYDHFSSTVDNAKEFGSSSSQIEESPKVHGSPARKIGRNKSGSDNILKTSKSENTLLKFFTVVKREQSLHQE